MMIRASTKNVSWVKLAWVLFAVGCASGADAEDVLDEFATSSSGGEDAGDPFEGGETHLDPWTPGDEGTGSSDGTDTTDTGNLEDCAPPVSPPSVVWATTNTLQVLAIDADATTVGSTFAAPLPASVADAVAVSQHGDAGLSFVALGSGERTIAVYRRDLADCVDTNGEPGVQTSAGTMDLLDFEDDECIAWSTVLTGDTGEFGALAWGRGTWSTEECRWHDADLWVGRTRFGFFSDEAEVVRVDGQTGDVLASIVVPDLTKLVDLSVDANGEVWVVGPGNRLGRLDPQTQQYTSVDDGVTGDVSHRGLTIDPEGRVWRCTLTAVQRVSPESGQVLSIPGPFDFLRDCAVDSGGRLWVAANDATGSGADLTAYSLETLDLLQQQDLGTQSTLTLAVDEEGRVWRTTPQQFQRWDPATGELIGLELPDELASSSPGRLATASSLWLGG